MRVVGALLMVGELLAGAYVGFVAFVMSGWMLDDHVAFKLAEEDWSRIALQRTAFWLIVALAYWGVVVGVNKLVMPRIDQRAARAFWLGLAGAILIAGASVAGAISFVVQKPFM